MTATHNNESPNCNDWHVDFFLGHEAGASAATDIDWSGFRPSPDTNEYLYAIGQREEAIDLWDREETESIIDRPVDWEQWLEGFRFGFDETASEAIK